MALTSRRISVESIEETVELIYANRWTDGLPVIPPFEPLVQRLIDGLDRRPDEIIGVIPPKQGVATLEKIAINCVMAGCKPEYVEVVIAALQAMLEPAFNLNAVQTTTHSVVPLTMVSGPVVKDMGFNYGDCVFGNIARPNGAVGRALRLIRWNIGGAIAGEMDRSTLGHPGEISYLIAESPEYNPWESIHVERGYQPEDSCVTVFGCEGPHHSVTGPGSAEQGLENIASVMATLGNNNIYFGGEILVVLGPRAAQTMAQGGFNRASIKQFLFEKARLPVSRLKRAPRLEDKATEAELWQKYPGADKDDTEVPVVRAPGKIHLIVSGGWGAPAAFCAVCPGWGYPGGMAQTKKIRLPDAGSR